VTGAAFLVPRTREELAELVREAARDRVPLFVSATGDPPAALPPSARVVCTRALDRVIAHEIGDLTLTAECGLAVDGAQALLAPHRQFVALGPRGTSIGAAIAGGRDGPFAARFGRIRDQVLGLVVVDGQGRITRSGGRVVKNVTGYDLCRLHAGSRGGLGIVVEATLRLRPLPEAARRIDCAAGDAAAAFACGLALRRRIPEIAAIELSGGPGAGVVVSATVAGLSEFVHAVSRDVHGIAAPLGPVSEHAADVRAPRRPVAPDGAAMVEIAAPPASWPGMVAGLRALLSPPLAWTHDILRGVRSSWHAGGAAVFTDEPALDAWLAESRATIDCPGDGGFAATLCARFPRQAPGGLALMRKLKAALDPARILNPGVNVYG
jgi:glycolate oxidase FAD binding subunit